MFSIKKHVSVILLVTFISFNATAQKGNNRVQLIAEAGIIPYGHYHAGFGGYGQILFGTGKSGHLVFTMGVSKFTQQFDENSSTTGNIIRLVPFLAGYRKNINKVYVQLQAGYGEYGGKIYIKRGGDIARPSKGAFYWALGTGYNIKRIDVGIRYQSAYSSKDIWLNESFNFLGLHIGYKFLKGKQLQ